MAKPDAEAPRRWVEESEASEDARLAELFRAVVAPRPMPSAELARVRERLRSKQPAMRSSRRLRELVMAVSMLLLGSSVVLAGWGVNEWLGGRSQPALQPAPQTAARQAAPTHARQRVKASAQPAASAVPEAPVTVPDQEPDATPEPNPARAKAVSERARPAVAPADSSGLAAEAAALERALIKLRREHDAAGALAILDESQQLLSKGTLSLEAQVARVDALLALRRQAEALAVLERLPLAQMGRGGELELMRAELRAGSDCVRALRDFDALVARALPASLMERALYGRAACELQVADRAQAEQDLNRYLARFPEGRFAERVRRELAKLNSQAQ